MTDSLWVVVIHAWCKICTQNCNAECSESSAECILSRGRRRLLPSQPCLPTWSGTLCRGDSAANGCGQAQIFPSAQARNISTHSARRTLTFSRPVTEVLANFTLTHVHFSLLSCTCMSVVLSGFTDVLISKVSFDKNWIKDGLGFSWSNNFSFVFILVLFWRL